jgi:hypothetical protein
VRITRCPNKGNGESNNNSDIPEANITIPIKRKVLVESVPIDDEFGDQNPSIKNGESRGESDPQRKLVERDPIHEPSPK